MFIFVVAFAFVLVYAVRNSRANAAQTAADIAECEQGRMAAVEYLARVGRPVAGAENVYRLLLDTHAHRMMLECNQHVWLGGYLEVIADEYMKYSN